MKFEVLKRSHLKRNIIIGVVVVAIISAVVLNFTRAKYRLTQSIPLINGTINYTLPDLNITTLYIDGVEATELDSNTNYTLNTEQSTCTYKDGTEISNLTLSYDSETQTFTITPYTIKGTKCTLYFEEDNPTAEEFILSNLTISSDRSGAITGTLTANTTGTIYSVADDYGTSYVYAGEVDNNWVSFAGFYWRIIRINGDGSIRLIYNGTTTDQTGTVTQIESSRFNISYSDNAYIGYMYGSANSSTYSQTHSNIYDSVIKDTLDTWYSSNIARTEYEQYISIEQGFCNDRQTMSGVWLGYGTLGYGTNPTTYAPLGRLMSSSNWRSSQNPSLECSQTNDYFTLSESSRGNHDLDYPIGLITSDEVVLAGGFGGSSNQNYYLYTNEHYWTMSPVRVISSGSASIFRVTSVGSLDNNTLYGYTTAGVRPVINLDASVQLSGTGTSTDPYKVEGA